jgi:hypothetical protein
MPDGYRQDRKTPVEIASDVLVMGAVRALCQCYLLVSQQNQSDLSLTALDNPLKQEYKIEGAF